MTDERREGPPRLRPREPADRRADHGPLAARPRTPARARWRSSSRRASHPAKIQIAHSGDSDDLGYIEGLLEKGVCIGLDRYGIEMYLPMDRRNATAQALLERGYADRMFLSADSCAHDRLVPRGDGRGAVARGRGEGLDDHADATTR